MRVPDLAGAIQLPRKIKKVKKNKIRKEKKLYENEVKNVQNEYKKSVELATKAQKELKRIKKLKHRIQEDEADAKTEDDLEKNSASVQKLGNNLNTAETQILSMTEELQKLDGRSPKKTKAMKKELDTLKALVANMEDKMDNDYEQKNEEEENTHALEWVNT